MMILTQSTGAITPVGWVLIIGFLVILIWGIFYDRKKAKNYSGEIDKSFEGKVADGNDVLFVTTDGELVSRFSSEGLSGYEVYKLDDIAYVMSAWDSSAGRWQLGIYDSRKKSVKGLRYSSRKTKPAKARGIFFVSEEPIEMREFVLKHAPKAVLVGKYFGEFKPGK